MSAPIELSLFDFVDEFAAEVEMGNFEGWDTVEEDSLLMTFCESFFDQFFAALGYNISGFDSKDKRKASELVERLRVAKEDMKHTRAIIALYESFCDMHDDIVESSYGSRAVTYEEFHTDYVSRLLMQAQEWAEAEGFEELADRITNACTRYDAVVITEGW